MIRKKTVFMGGMGALFIAFAISGLVLKFSDAASSSDIDWFTLSPSVVKEQDYTTTPSTSIENCTLTNVQIPDTTTYQNLCMTPTAMGLMTQIYSNWGFAQPQSWTKAYNIDYRKGGNPIIQPVPNQASGVYYAPSGQGDWITVGLFYQIANHIKLGGIPPFLSYTFGSGMTTPDMIFKHPNGDGVQFKYANDFFNFSSNGRYMIARSNQGFMRLNIMNPSMQFFAPYDTGTSSYAGINESGRYAVISYLPADSKLQYVNIIDINSCSVDVPATSSSPAPSYASCKKINVLPAIKQALPNVDVIYKPQFVNDRTVTFIARYKDASGALKYSQYSMTADGQAKSLKYYEAVGDSYISGEGAYDYRQGTDTERNQCHQSLLSYPYLLGSKLSSFASVACSGARMQNILKSGNKNVDQLVGGIMPADDDINYAKDNYVPGVVQQYDFVKKDNPEAVTISIGGNDIGFSDIVQTCVNPIKNFSDNLGSNFTCYSTYEDRKEVMDNIDRQFTRLRSVYETLKNDGVKGRRVYVVGYPQVMKVDGNCGVNVQMNSDEVKFAHDLIVHLDSVIKRAADEAGVQYVDTEHALDGYRLCEAPGDQTAVNGITINKNSVGQVDIKASFHPNKLGHELLAAAVAEQTDNLTKPMPGAQPKTNTVAANPNDAIYQGAPKTGRPVSQIIFADNLASSSLAPLQAISLTAKAADYGIKPGGAYKLSLGTANLGNYTADANGDLNLNAVVSAGVPPGFQAIHITGTDAYGTPIDVQQVVYVVAAPGDMDGDGVPDASDSCILAAQSGQDADKDGIDDACDPQITDPPATTPSEDGIIWWSNAVLPITIESTTGP